MPAKKVQISSDLYGKEPGAVEKLAGDTGPGTAPATANPTSDAVEEVKPQGKTRNVKPTSFYLTDKQLRKLDDLAYLYNGRTGKRINRNDVIRHLVDTCDIGSLHGL